MSSSARRSTLIDSGSKPLVIDVRSSATARLDPRRIPGAVLIDLGDICRHVAGLPRDRDILLYCNAPMKRRPRRLPCCW